MGPSSGHAVLYVVDRARKGVKREKTRSMTLHSPHGIHDKTAAFLARAAIAEDFLYSSSRCKYSLRQDEED